MLMLLSRLNIKVGLYTDMKGSSGGVVFVMLVHLGFGYHNNEDSVFSIMPDFEYQDLR